MFCWQLSVTLLVSSPLLSLLLGQRVTSQCCWIRNFFAVRKKKLLVLDFFFLLKLRMTAALVHRQCTVRTAHSAKASGWFVVRCLKERGWIWGGSRTGGTFQFPSLPAFCTHVWWCAMRVVGEGGGDRDGVCVVNTEPGGKWNLQK